MVKLMCIIGACVQNKFQNETESAHAVEEVESIQVTDISDNLDSTASLVSSGETVLMQTAKTKIRNTKNQMQKDVRVLLDCESQRTYVTQRLADQLCLPRGEDTEIKVATFGNNRPSDKNSIHKN